MLSVEVAKLLESKPSLELKVIAGKKGLIKRINIPRIQKPGLALVGDTSKLHPGRVQVFGKSELNFLESLSVEKLNDIVEKICSIDISCLIITRGNKPPKVLIKEAEKKNIPLLVSSLVTSTFINRVTRFLEDILNDKVSVHGVLMDVLGVGILLIGKSGIGKSECALDLIIKGYRFVADDVVEIRKRPPSTLIGLPSETLKNHIEIRGVGILNIRDLFGIAALTDKKNIDMVIELVEWNPDYDYDRLGIQDKYYIILDVAIPYLKIPVSSGRNTTAVVEVAARNMLLKQSGHHSSRLFVEKLDQTLVAPTFGRRRLDMAGESGIRKNNKKENV